MMSTLPAQDRLRHPAVSQGSAAGLCGICTAATIARLKVPRPHPRDVELRVPAALKLRVPAALIERARLAAVLAKVEAAGRMTVPDPTAVNLAGGAELPHGAAERAMTTGPAASTAAASEDPLRWYSASHCRRLRSGLLGQPSSLPSAPLLFVGDILGGVRAERIKGSLLEEEEGRKEDMRAPARSPDAAAALAAFAAAFPAEAVELAALAHSPTTPESPASAAQTALASAEAAAALASYSRVFLR